MWAKCESKTQDHVITDGYEGTEASQSGVAASKHGLGRNFARARPRRRVSHAVLT